MTKKTRRTAGRKQRFAGKK